MQNKRMEIKFFDHQFSLQHVNLATIIFAVSSAVLSLLFPITQLPKKLTISYVFAFCLRCDEFRRSRT